MEHVLFSDAATRAATNAEQWYVTISRGRKSIRIFTTDKAQLAQSIRRAGHRELALDLFAPPTRNKRIREQIGLMQWKTLFPSKCAPRRAQRLHFPSYRLRHDEPALDDQRRASRRTESAFDEDGG